MHYLDYCYHTKLHQGSLQKLMAAEVTICPERNKAVLLLLNEIHVREDLVYDKHSGELTGFTNFGDINSHNDAFEQLVSLSQLLQCTLTSAKTVTVFTV